MHANPDPWCVGSLGAMGYPARGKRWSSCHGETGKARDLLERLVGIPYFLTPQYLAIDPNFASLHGHPRFERLVRGAATQAP